jgi:hypothetical protein
LLGKKISEISELNEMIGISTADDSLWFMAELAVIGYQRGVVGTFAQWMPKDIFSAWELSGVSTVVLDQTTLEHLNKNAMGWPKNIKHIIIIDWLPPFFINDQDKSPPIRPANLPLESTFEIVLFSPNPTYFIDPPDKLHLTEITDKERNAVVIFTSGTSGSTPKGVRSSCETWSQKIGRPYKSPRIAIYSPAWSTGKVQLWKGFFSGSLIGIPAKNLHALDLFPVLSPKAAIFVPSLADDLKKIYFKIVDEEFLKLPHINKQVAMAQAHAKASDKIYNEILGGDVKTITLGGAKIK